MGIGRSIFFVGAGAAACWIGYGFYLDSQRNARIERDLALRDLPAFARDSIDELYKVGAHLSEEKEARITETGPALSIGTMQSTFNLDARRLVPQIFTSFPEVQKVVLIRVMTGTDPRGNDGQVKAIEMDFSRDNSKTINWDKVAFSALPSIADGYWANPTLK